MIQGTTPTHVFVLPFPASETAQIQITYAQQGEIRLQKWRKDCSLNGNEVTVRLTQQETLRFQGGPNVRVQLRVLTKSGAALAGNIETIPCVRILARDVIE